MLFPLLFNLLLESSFEVVNPESIRLYCTRFSSGWTLFHGIGEIINSLMVEEYPGLSIDNDLRGTAVEIRHDRRPARLGF